ncbi:MAG TPA: hypothetical protein DCR40_05230 [Prolixibacteraceae bacterium]|nr:hypothetical protein [Prolixibacteraceae bacterium]
MRHIYIHANSGTPQAAVVPTIEIVSITNITSNGATVLARVLSDGGSTIYDYRFYFYAAMQPAVDVHVSPNPDGTFNCTVSTLATNVQYYLTASATNSVGSGGASQYFTTGTSVSVPTIRINSIGDITGISASVACEILSKGGGTITVSGICWNTTGSPTTANSKTTNGITEVGTFISAMTGLQAGVTYYVKEYATNEAGTSYSNVGSFATTNRVLILQFDTNCPPSKTFNPWFDSVAGTYEWELGDGTIVQGVSVSHNYADSSTKTVKLYCVSGIPSIIRLSFIVQYIKGGFNISHSAFSTLIWIDLYNNLELTSLLLATNSSSLEFLRLDYTGLTGNLNLSAITKLNDANFAISNCPNLTGVAFASSFTQGSVRLVTIQYCNITGTLDLSMFTSWAALANYSVIGMPLLTAIIPPPNCSGVNISNALFVSLCPSLAYSKLTFFTDGPNINGASYHLVGNNWSTSIVNQILFEINAIAIAGYVSRQITIYSNAPVDSNSGGYNGTAAKAALVAKGFQVSTD